MFLQVFTVKICRLKKEISGIQHMCPSTTACFVLSAMTIKKQFAKFLTLKRVLDGAHLRGYWEYKLKN